MSLMLADLPLEELLSHLAERGATGTVTVTARRRKKKLYLIDGRLAGLGSDNPRELLGHFLVGWGLISEVQLAEAMQIHERLGTPLGRILEHTGAIDAATLERALIAQAEEGLLELFLLTVTDKRFLENVIPADRPLVLHLSLPDLVMEGLRRRERRIEIERALGALNVVPARTEGPLPDGLTGRELHILAEVDGTRDIEALALTCHLVPFAVAEAVERGVKEGFLTAAPAGQAVAPDAAELAARSQEALAAGDLRLAWLAVEQLRGAAAAPSARVEVGQIERGIAEALAQRRIAGNLVPRLVDSAAVGRLASLRPAEAFVLSRVNDRWSLREIQRITPVEELEFGVIVATLLDAGAIELRHPKGGPAF